ncbi:MAG: class I tRNA ligase family protein, partial [Nanoarchaeota archaeon]
EKFSKIENYLEKVQLRNAFLEILSLSSIGNKYFNDNEPWDSVKKNAKRTSHVLYLCASLCRTLSILTQPYLPVTSQKIWEQLNLEGTTDKKGIWDSATDLSLSNNHIINKPAILFNKLIDDYLEKFKKQVSDTKSLKELVNV